MTDKTLRRLTHKKRLTGKERAALLREATRRLGTITTVLYCVADSCDEEQQRIDETEGTITREQIKRANRLSDTRDDLEEIVEGLDDLNLPEPQDVL